MSCLLAGVRKCGGPLGNTEQREVYILEEVPPSANALRRQDARAVAKHGSGRFRYFFHVLTPVPDLPIEDPTGIAAGRRSAQGRRGRERKARRTLALSGVLRHPLFFVDRYVLPLFYRGDSSGSRFGSAESDCAGGIGENSNVLAFADAVAGRHVPDQLGSRGHRLMNISTSHTEDRSNSHLALRRRAVGISGKGGQAVQPRQSWN